MYRMMDYTTKISYQLFIEKKKAPTFIIFVCLN
jgi:hypothetical protein